MIGRVLHLSLSYKLATHNNQTPVFENHANVAEDSGNVRENPISYHVNVHAQRVTDCSK